MQRRWTAFLIRLDTFSWATLHLPISALGSACVVPMTPHLAPVSSALVATLHEAVGSWGKTVG